MSTSREEKTENSMGTGKSADKETADKEIKEMSYTKYERARMIGSRALQIAMGAPFLVKLEQADLERLRYSPIEIASLEYKEGVIPITVRRPFPRRIRREAPKAK